MVDSIDRFAVNQDFDDLLGKISWFFLFRPEHVSEKSREVILAVLLSCVCYSRSR